MNRLTIYLDAPTLQQAREGRQNFVSRVIDSVRQAGWQAELALHDVAAEIASAHDAGWSLFHMAGPEHPRALFMRRAYVGAFWRIEKTPRRWESRTALATFSPDQVDADEAHKFARNWRNWTFGKDTSPTRGGYILAPLQGRLTEHRSFQSMSPIEMLRATLQHQPERTVIATLHPREEYSQSDLAALRDLANRNPHLQISDKGSDTWLPACDAVVTQNSSVAFLGFFLRKPAVLFAQSDFHHIAGVVHPPDIRAAFDFATKGARPDFEKYLLWFLRYRSINAGKPEAEDQIRRALVACGVPIGR